jgi:hypothetical protein
LRTHTRRRRTLAAAAAFGLAGLLAGCGGVASTPQVTGGATTDQVKGQVSIWLDDNAVNPCFVKTVTGSYTNPDVQLKIELKKD